MNTPDDLRYSPDHEWVRVEANGLRIGITDYAQDNLGDVVYLEPPEVGSHVEAGARVTEVESTKSVSEIYAPVAGTVVEINTELDQRPELVNQDPYGEGWIYLLQPDDPAAVEGLLDAEGYLALLRG